MSEIFSSFDIVKQRLASSAESVADIYVPFVEGHDDCPATLGEILSDPLCSYQQVFDTVWTNHSWTEEDSVDALRYVLDENSERLNRMAIVNGAGLALLFRYDDRKFCFLLDLLEGRQSEVCIRAMVMIMFAYAHYLERGLLSPDLCQRLEELLFAPAFHPLLLAVQKAFLVIADSARFSQKFEEQMPANMKEMHDKMAEIPEGISSDELKDYVENDPELMHFHEEMLVMMRDYAAMQSLGIDIGFQAFATLSPLTPFFHEAANWFCPFSFDHPLLFNINAATRFVGLVAQDKTCDTDKYLIVLNMMDHLPEIHIVKQDAVTLEETHIGENEVEGFMEMFSEKLVPSESGGEMITELPFDDLYRRVVSVVQDAHRFFMLFDELPSSSNPFLHDLTFWCIPPFCPAFETQSARKELAETYFALEKYDEALSFFLQVELSSEILQKIAYSYERQGKHKKAQLYYRQALQGDPDNERLQKLLLESYQQTSDYTQAVALLKQMIDVSPDDLHLIRLYAEANMQLERYDVALPLFTKLDYLRPNHVSVQRALAWCYLVSRDYEHALRLYDIVLQSDKATADDWYRAAHAALVADNVNLAVERYRRSLTLRGISHVGSDFLASELPFLVLHGVEPAVVEYVVDLINMPEN